VCVREREKEREREREREGHTDKKQGIVDDIKQHPVNDHVPIPSLVVPVTQLNADIHHHSRVHYHLQSCAIHKIHPSLCFTSLFMCVGLFLCVWVFFVDALAPLVVPVTALN